MTIYFTDEELEWINKKPFNWTIKKGCPKNIEKKLKGKLDVLYNKPQGVGEWQK